jgi:hypothetical protein
MIKVDVKIKDDKYLTIEGVSQHKHCKVHNFMSKGACAPYPY